jgi:pimeloyl-ACP methyl ester carboxylesterase
MVLCTALLSPASFAAEGVVVKTTPATAAPPTFVFAFVGGFVHADDSRHTEVRLIQRLREEHPNEIEGRVFRNRHHPEAYQLIRQRLDTNHDGTLSAEEKQGARILLFGHSWGASAIVLLARRLERDGIPVLFTAQVDSVAKPGQNDSVIPANVRQAVNFYQPNGLVHGRARITAADPNRTQILGNFRLTYKRDTVDCSGYPWYDLLFTRTHTEIECDPKVWNQVESLIRNQLPSTATTMSDSSAPPAAGADSTNRR